MLKEKSTYSYLCLLSTLLFFSYCGGKTSESAEENADLPRVAIAGLAIESSTFSPAVSEEDAFLARRGGEVFDYYPFMRPDSINRSRAKWFLEVSFQGRHTSHWWERLWRD